MTTLRYSKSSSLLNKINFPGRIKIQLPFSLEKGSWISDRRFMEITPSPDQQILKILFFSLFIFIGLNIFLNLILSLKNRDPIFKKMLFFWFLFFLAQFCQSMFQASEIQIILSYATLFFPTLCLAFLIFEEFKNSFPLNLYLFLGFLSLFLTFLLNYFHLSYSIIYLPLTITNSIPLIHTLYLIFYKKKKTLNYIDRVLGIIIFLSIIQYLIFYYYKVYGGIQLWSWAAAFFLTQGFSLILPIFTFRVLSKNENQRLENLVDLRIKEKSNLLRIILHDLITPLNCIWDYVEGWKKGIISEEKAYTIIEGFMEDIKQLVGEVREIEKQKVGRKDLFKDSVGAWTCILETLERLNKELVEKNIRVEFEHSVEEEVYFYGNKSLFINSILTNILKNSIKFSFEGSKIKIDLRKKRNFLIIKITDHGIGIPRKIMKKLFVEGEGISRPGTKGELGHGLGLLILKESVTLLNGNLQIKSTSIKENIINHGTTVSITFPIFKNQYGGNDALNNC
jgi:signal transduction histidine kinase